MPGEIEFLDSEPTSGDEEFLAQPGRHRRPGTMHPRRTGQVAIGVGAAALIGGVLLARAATGDGGSSTAAPSTGPFSVGTSYVATNPLTGSDTTIGLTPSAGNEVLPTRTLCPRSVRPMDAAALPSALVSLPVPRPRIAGVTTPTGKALVPPVNDSGESANCVSAAAATCPEAGDGLSACATVQGLPAAVFDAVRDQYPKAQVTASFTEIARETRLIWYRSVTVVLDPDATIGITLEQSGNDPGTSGEQLFDQRFEKVRAVHTGEHLNTVVEFTGLFGRHASTVKLATLAADDRLATVS